MSKQMTFDEFETLLRGFGFTPTPHGGTHARFRHAGTGAIVTAPKIEPSVRPAFVAAARRQIADFGIASVAEFDVSLNVLRKKEVDTAAERTNR